MALARKLTLGLQVNIGLRVLTRPIPNKLPEIYRTLGTEYAERVLPSIIQARRGHVAWVLTRWQAWQLREHVSVQETLKSVIAQYNASQLLTMREVTPFQHETGRKAISECRVLLYNGLQLAG